MKKRWLLLLIFFLPACEADHSKSAARKKLRFTTTDDAQLFFKNLRRTDYDYQNLAASQLDIFRHSERPQQAAYPLLLPALVMNRQHNEAYILLEANEALGELVPLQLEWRDKAGQKKGQYILESLNKMEQLRFADQLYQGMRQGQQFYLLRDSLSLPLLNLPADRRVFRTTMADFYQLTGTRR